MMPLLLVPVSLDKSIATGAQKSAFGQSITDDDDHDWASGADRIELRINKHPCCRQWLENDGVRTHHALLAFPSWLRIVARQCKIRADPARDRVGLASGSIRNRLERASGATRACACVRCSRDLTRVTPALVAEPDRKSVV